MAKAGHERAAQSVTAGQLATYRREGAVLLKGAIEPAWIAALGEVAEDMKLRAADNTGYYGDDREGQRTTVVKDDVWRESAAMMRFLRESGVARVAAEAMGSTHARIYEDLLLYKESGAGPTPWHQDEPQWPVGGTHMTSLWISLEATTPDTGSLRFAAGTHKGPLYVPYVPDWQRDDLRRDMHLFTGGTLPDVEADPARFPVRTFTTEPGDVILFHPRVIHAAVGSDARRPRRTFSIRFLGDDIRWQPKASVFHDWLRDIDLPAGAPLAHDRFPRFWPMADEMA